MSAPKVSRKPPETDLMAELLDAAPQLWSCREFSSLGSAALRLFKDRVPVAWSALWVDESETQAPMHWAAELDRGGMLLPSTLPPAHGKWRTVLPEDGWVAKDFLQCENPSANLQWFLEKGLRSSLIIPLSGSEGMFGGLALASREPGAFEILGPRFPGQLGRFLAPIVEQLARRLAPDPRLARLTRELDRHRLILAVNNQLALHLEPRDLFQAISATLRRHFTYDSISLIMLDEGGQGAHVRFVDFPTGRGFIQENQRITSITSPTFKAIFDGQAVVATLADLRNFAPPIAQVLVEGEGFQSICAVPLRSRGRVIGSLNFGSRLDRAFSPEDVDLFLAVANQVALALDNATAYEQIQQLRDRLAEEKLYLEEEVREEFAFGEIIGHSPSLQKVLRQIQTVAPSDATVLLLGETGTGKELMARALHNLSPRKDHTFVKMNCAAIPLGLVESELFGHEKGAFTGAIAQKTGRLELAHQGSLFLDEVGEISLELQPKLLRAIQEREFERLGSTKTRKVDIRLVAATNRDLARMVQEGSFRSDLYYRLKVFPIHMPPLRERQEDIPLLVSYFTQKYAQRMKRRIESVPTRAMEALMAWPWPGNIRELENFIERCVILSQGSELYVPISELVNPAPLEGSAPLIPMRDAEREHILKALQEAQGKLGGINGAAARLGMKRTTLQSRMQKLGISAKSI